MQKKDLIKYFKTLGLDVHTSTKARGHQGFYINVKNRIDISKDLPEELIIPTLLHEFAHYIHSKIEPNIHLSGGNLEILFNDKENIKLYERELLVITNLVDKHSQFDVLNRHKKIIKGKLNEYEKTIKNKYPKFLRSQKFKEFDKYIKNSKAKYLLKSDRIKLISGWFGQKSEILTIDSLEKDFSDMPKEFIAYIKLKSCQRKQTRITSRMNKLKKYYTRPTELFARLVEGLYLYPQQVKILAPLTYNRFYQLLNNNYYLELADVFKILKNP